MTADAFPPRRSILSKLRGRSAAELRSRGMQLAHAWMERAGLSSLTGEPTDRSHPRHLRSVSPTLRPSWGGTQSDGEDPVDREQDAAGHEAHGQ